MQKTNNLKILFFNVFPLPHSIDLQSELEKKNYIIDFWYLNENTKLYPWKKNYTSKNYNIYSRNINLIYKLIVSIRSSDLVIITGWQTLDHVLLALICKLFSVPYALWLDVPSTTSLKSYFYFKKIFLSLANGLFVTGKNGINIISNHYNLNRDKFFDFPYLESTKLNNYFSSKPNKIIDKLYYNKRINVLLSNRFIERKGYDIILKSLSMLSQKELNSFSFIFLGSGPLFEYYKSNFNKLSKNILLKGWIEYDDYLEYLVKSDVYVHSSIHEPYGIPPIDAMKLGKLVIASTGVMSCMDRIQNGENGFLFNYGNPEELTKIFKIILDNKSLIQSLGLEAKETSIKYGIDYNISSINNFIKWNSSKN